MLARIPPNSLEGLTPLAVRSLTPESIQALTPHQLFRITSDAALALDFSHTEVMTKEQKDALMVTIALDRDNFFVDHRVAKGNTRLFAGFVGDSEDGGGQDLPDKPLESRLGPKNTTTSSKKTGSGASKETETVLDARAVNATEEKEESLDPLDMPEVEGLGEGSSPNATILQETRSTNGSTNGTVSNGTMAENTTTTTTTTSTTTEAPKAAQDVSTMKPSGAITNSPLNSLFVISSVSVLIFGKFFCL
jgi:hypothetical protein